MNTFESYRNLKKPSFAPPASVFGPVWSVLYVLIAYSFSSVFYDAYQGVIPALVALPFALNLLFNVLFTPIQFGLKNNALASIDILLVLGTLVTAIIFIYPYSHTLAFLQVPYLLWVSFASVLQLTITYINR